MPRTRASFSWATAACSTGSTRCSSPAWRGTSRRCGWSTEAGRRRRPSDTLAAVNLPLLTELCEAAGPPGREERVRDVVVRELEPLVDHLEVDPLGNVIARSVGEGPRLMLSAHMDEIGFMVTHVDDGGFL